MYINKQFPDTPFHFNYISMVEGDNRRHNHRCFYYDKQNKKCTANHSPYYNKTCCGSSTCENYTEDSPKKKLSNTSPKLGVWVGDVIRVRNGNNAYTLYVTKINNNIVHGYKILKYHKSIDIDDEKKYILKDPQLKVKLNAKNILISFIEEASFDKQNTYYKVLMRLPDDEQNVINEYYNMYLENETDVSDDDFGNSKTACDVEEETNMFEEQTNYWEDDENVEEKPNETKAEKFVRLGEKRVENIRKGINRLKNLSNRNNYEYNDALVDEMFSFLENELLEAKKSFTKEKSQQFKFNK